MNLKKILPCLLAFAAMPVLADAIDCTPKRVGPVSYYGALHTSGGKIIGAKNEQQAMLRGVSLFWSDGTGLPYYKKEVIAWAAENLKIDVFRFAMGIEYYDSDGGTKNKLTDNDSYKGSPESYLSLVDNMVAAAIESDVYIILDWHSHRAHLESGLAKSFFEFVAAKYKDVPNVIYEIYNEPVSGSGGDWGAVKSYANTICPAIRKSTENLILVGTPNWSQNPQNGASDPVNATNIAYVLHFYAATHSKGSYSSRIDQTISKYPVFISEWGTTNADGDGEPNASATSEWTSYMDQNNISNCNWSLRQQTSNIDKKSEKSAIFNGETPLTTISALSEATYTSSGKIIKEYLEKNARSWPDSIIKGKNTGNCAFKATSAKQTESKLGGLLKSGCTYTSSNENVVSISGSDLIINDYGFSILKGDDGSESIVSITQVAGQTIPAFENVTCNYTGTCTSASGSAQNLDYDKDGKTEFSLTPDDKTIQGADFTMTSLNPEIVKVEKSTCSHSSCSNTQTGKKVWMFEFESFGEAKIVATAPAVTGYRAMQDTIIVKYEKGKNRITNKFKDTKIAVGGTAQNVVPDTTLMSTKLTYTFDGKESSPYVSKVGNNLVAGSENAIVTVTAFSEESELYKQIEQSITVTIGDANAAVNLAEHQAYLDSKNNVQVEVDPPIDPIGEAIFAKRATIKGINAQINGSTLQFNIEKAGKVSFETYDAIGNRVMATTNLYKAGNHAISLESIASGSYVTIIRQGSAKTSIRWNKQ